MFLDRVNKLSSFCGMSPFERKTQFGLHDHLDILDVIMSVDTTGCSCHNHIGNIHGCSRRSVGARVALLEELAHEAAHEKIYSEISDLKEAFSYG